MAGEQLDLPIVATITGQAAFDQAAAGIKQVQGATQGLNDTQRTMRKETEAAAAAIRGQRMATTQLGMQISQASTQMAAGTSVGLVFAQQIGDIGYALSGMNGKLGAVGAFLQGPWGVALSIAGMGLFALMNSMKETEKASDSLNTATQSRVDSEYTVRLALAGSAESYRAIRKEMYLTAQASMITQASIVKGLLVEQNKLIGQRQALRAQVSGAGGLRAQAEMATGVSIEMLGVNRKLTDQTSSLNAETEKLEASTAAVNNLYASIMGPNKKFGSGAGSAASGISSSIKKTKDDVQQVEDIMQSMKFNDQKTINQFIKDSEKAGEAIANSLPDLDVLLNTEYTKKGLEALYAPINRAKEMSEAMGRSFSDGIKGMITGAMSFRDMMSNVIDSVINKLFEMFVVQQIVGLVGKAVTAVGIPGFKAIGGSVQSDQPYIVGERGPEMFVPSRSGSIVPNNKMGGGINISVDARGSSDPAAVRQQVELGIAQAAPYIIAAAQNRTLRTAGRTRLPGTIG
jgi:hypothetical protein